MDVHTPQELSPEESLQIIDKVMSETRYKLGDNRFAFLFWGYFTFVLSLLHFTLWNLGAEYHWIGWTTTPLGWVVMYLYYRNREEKQQVKHGVGDIFAWLWGILGLNLLIIGFLGHHVIGESFIAIIILILSLGTLASGAILKFRPLIIGSILTNFLAWSALLFIPFEFHLLLTAVAAILCDIIPGHLLKSK